VNRLSDDFVLILEEIGVSLFLLEEIKCQETLLDEIEFNHLQSLLNFAKESCKRCELPYKECWLCILHSDDFELFNDTWKLRVGGDVYEGRYQLSFDAGLVTRIRILPPKGRDKREADCDDEKVAEVNESDDGELESIGFGENSLPISESCSEDAPFSSELFWDESRKYPNNNETPRNSRKRKWLETESKNSEDGIKLRSDGLED